MILINYLRRQVLKPFIAISLVLVGVFVSFMAARYLAQAAEGKIPASIIGRLILLRVLIAQEVLLPTTFYFSVLLALGRLYRQAEMVAMFAAGLSPLRVYWAVLSLALMVAVVSGVFSLHLRPWAWEEFYRLKASSEREFDLRRLKAGVFYELPGGRVFFADKVDRHQALAEEVFLYGRDEGGPKIIRAARAWQEIKSQRLFLILDQGRQYEFNEKHSLILVSEFAALKIFVANLETPRKQKVKAMPTRELWPPAGPEEVAELEWRLAAPLSAILLAFLAINLSPVKPRQGHLKRIPLAVVFFAAYFYAGAALKKLLAKGLWPVFPGIGAAHLGLLLLSVICYYWFARR
ncbi:MAG: LPS export ABC transporter permease LptF [Thermodesulfobacteria bacterium]|nr:LPS export ABC transporter permease LptF [Thermodesulfobacteriota bacterium]